MGQIAVTPYDLLTFIDESSGPLAGGKSPKPGNYLTRRPILKRVFILDREDPVKQLHDKLTTAPYFVVLSGIGGIGKTAAAKKYLIQHGNVYDQLLWLEASESIASVFLEQITPSAIGFTANPQLTPQENLQKLFYRLEQLKGRTLCVIDGLDNPKELRDIYESIPENLRVLITSRVLNHPYPKVPLDSLAPDDAAELFERVYNGKPPASELADFLETIKYHTLTIDLVAKTLRNNFHLQLADLTTSLKERPSEEEEDNSGVTAKLIKVFKVANLEDIETKLLHLLSLIPSRLYTYQEIEGLVLPDLNTQPPPLKKVTAAFTELKISPPAELSLMQRKTLVATLNTLSEKGWMSYQQERFYMHPIYGLVLRKVVTDEAQAALLPIAYFLAERLGHLVLGAKSQEQVAAGGNSLLVSIAVDFLQHFRLTTPVTYLANRWLSAVLFTSNQFAEALVATQRALSQLNKVNTPDIVPHQAVLVSRQAAIFRELGDYQQAIKVQKGLIDALRKTGTAYIDLLGTALVDLSILYKYSGEIEKGYAAVKASLSHLKTYRESLRPITVATITNDSTAILLDKGEYEVAMEYLKESESISRNLPATPRNTLLLSDTLNNQASVLTAWGKPALALVKQKEAVTLQESLGNFNSPVLAHKYTKLANIYRLLHQYEPARSYQDIAVDLREKIYGNSHPLYAHSLNYQAMLLFDLGQPEEGIAAGERALAIRRERLADGSFEIGESLLNLGKLYFATGKQQAAQRHLSDACQILKALNHPLKKIANDLLEQLNGQK